MTHPVEHPTNTPAPSLIDPSRRRGLPWRSLLTALCLLIAAGATVFPLVAFPMARHEARLAAVVAPVPSASASSNASSSNPSAAGTQNITPSGLGLTELPILSPELSSELTSMDAATIERLIDEHATTMGYDVAALRAGGLADDAANPNALASNADPVNYPYEYANTEAAASGQGTPEQLIDLASLFELSAAHNEWRTNGEAAVAYVLLRQAHSQNASCAVELAIQHLVLLGIEPRDNAIEDSSRDAIKACPTNPTPRWLRALFLARVHFKDGWPQAMTVEDYAPARSAFEDLAAQPATHTLGTLGLVDLEMARARNGIDLQRRPFTVRSAYTKAVELLDDLGDAANSPAAVFTKARALCGLDRCSEGAALLAGGDFTSLPSQDQLTAAAIHAKAGHPNDAAKALEATRETPPSSACSSHVGRPMAAALTSAQEQ